MSDAIQFVRERFPELFRRGVENLRRRAGEGSEGAKRRLADVEQACGVAWIRLEGAGDVFLRVTGGEIAVADGKPDDLPIRVALAVPADAADVFVSEATQHADLESDSAAYAAARTASAQVERAVGAEPLEFHVILKDTPDFEEVVVKVGLNAPEPPESPRFTATVAWDDLEALRRGELQPQQLFMGGKLRFGGDYSRALAIGMQLMQQR